MFDDDNNYRLNKDDIKKINDDGSEKFSENSDHTSGSLYNSNNSSSYSNINYSNSTYSGRSNSQGSPFYYSESYNKKKSKKGYRLNMLQLVAIVLISSILGGGVVFSAFQFIAPAIQPEFSSYFDRMTGKNVASNSPANGQDAGKSYKIEIEKTNSPVTWIAKKVSPSIVGIRVTAKVQNFFFGEQQDKGEGSGIIVRDNGYILTNFHVIEKAYDSRTNKVSGSATVEVFLPNQEDKPYKAEIVGVDWRTDLAVLKINGTGLPAAELGDSDALEVGELAVTIGNPGGLEYMGSVTAGVISGLNRRVQTENGYEFKLIQTDAAINPGNSGGALVNSEGKVIGVNSIKVVAQGFEGIGFAIPINTAKDIFENLIEHKYVPGRPLLGLRADPDFNSEAARYYKVPEGVLVKEVIPFSGAYKAGIKVGDIVVKCEGTPVKSLDELNTIKDKYKPGDIVKLEIYRDNKTLTIEVELGEDKPLFDEQ
ncbi:MAG TPA: trypsin-like peptidase domain-containing protein [Clostridiales bacterium]|nr:trypsin-like peptidase domain-containing protein [Clostridiales bacterium]